MAHNAELLARKGSEWGKKVRIIAVSSDYDKEKLSNWIKERNWTQIEHFMIRDGVATSSESTMFNDYNAKAIPFVILVDTNGVIRYSGHPFYLKTEQVIDSLINGE